MATALDDVKPDTVTGIQRALSALGLRVEPDGMDGPRTEAAVRTFQAYAGLTVDGVVGPETRASLLKELSRH